MQATARVSYEASGRVFRFNNFVADQVGPPVLEGLRVHHAPHHAPALGQRGEGGRVDHRKIV